MIKKIIIFTAMQKYSTLNRPVRCRNVVSVISNYSLCFSFGPFIETRILSLFMCNIRFCFANSLHVSLMIKGCNAKDDRPHESAVTN